MSDVERVAAAMWEAPFDTPYGKCRRCSWETLLYLASPDSPGSDGRERDAENVAKYRALAAAALREVRLIDAEAMATAQLGLENAADWLEQRAKEGSDG